MRASIEFLQANAEFLIPEGCYINELSNSDNDPDVSIAQARLKPGVTTQWHRLSGITERYVILAGQARVEVGDLPATDITVGDTVVIPPLCRQRITNTGSDDLLFLAICSPRFMPQAYQPIQ